MNASILLAIVAGCALAWATFVALLWFLRPRDARLGELLRLVPDVLRFGRDLIRDRTVPLPTRVAVAGLVIYLLNPIDLIPDVIPIVGALDDVVVAVLVLRYVRRVIGPEAFRRRWPGTDEGFALLARVL